jgi:adenine-specific DNA-methyltransferase
MLAEAMCKLEGFSYAPSQDRYWEHGHSTERDFIYVTTQRLTQRQLHAISEEVGPDRSLLICSSAFRCAPDQWPNLTLKKIPNAVKDRCEWGRDDYSLSISNLPPADTTDSDNDPSPSPTSKKGARARKPTTTGQAGLFTEGEQA